MDEVFDYDVFLSFASTDEELARPVWQELCLSGLRVFWSDASLKQRLGEVWFDSIESSLERSRHLVVIVSPASMRSEWVKREYQAFYNHCFRAGSRRLIPALAGGYKPSEVPLFLRQLEAVPLGDADAVRTIARLLGGTNVEELKRAVLAREEENRRLVQATAKYESEVAALTQELSTAKQQRAALAAQLADAGKNLVEPAAMAATVLAGQRDLSQPAQPPEALPEEGLRDIINEAIDEVGITLYGTGYVDQNASLVGKKLHSRCQGGEIPILCSALGLPDDNWQRRVKTYLLLKYCCCQRIPASLARQALQTFCTSLAGGPDPRLAAEAIKQIALPLRDKWTDLMDVVNASSAKGGHHIIDCLGMCTPPEKRDVTGQAVCDVLSFAVDGQLVSACIKALRVFNHREGQGALEEMLDIGGTLDRASQIARLLADWGASSATVILKDVIERWRFSDEDPSSFRELVTAYYRLGGSSTAEFIAHVFTEAPDQVQQYLIYAVPQMGLEQQILDAVAHVALHATTPQTRKAAHDQLTTLRQSPQGAS